MPINQNVTPRMIHEERGAVAVIVALGLTMLLGFLAISVDIAMIYRERAALQAKGDVTALSAVANIDIAQARAQTALQNNSQDIASLEQLQLGRYLRNPAIPAAQRFTALDAGDPGINALALVLRTTTPLYFSQIFMDGDTAPMSVSASATRTGAASFTLGSQLARLGSLALSDALSEALGIQVNLSAGDINVLANARINAADLLNALSKQIGFDSLNPAEILDQTVSAQDLIAALQTVSPGTVSQSLSALGTASSLQTFNVGELVSGADSALGLTTMDFLGDTTFTARDAISALAERGATGSPIAVDVSANVSGLLDLETSLSMGSMPVESGVVALGESGVSLHNADARFKTELTLEPSLLGNLGIGVASIVATSLELPVYVELAGTTATLTELSCVGTETSTLAAAFSTAHSDLHPGNGSSVAALYLGSFANDPMNAAEAIDPAGFDYADILNVSITIPVPLLPDIHLAQVTFQARSHVAAGQSQTEEITFTKGDVADGPSTKYFGSGELLASAVESLLSPANLDLRVKPNQSGLAGSVINSVVSGLLNLLPSALLAGVLSPLDNVLDNVLASAGVQLGVGELTLTDHHCEVPRLIR
ncbi:MAG: hypothetical protein WBC85_13795 [Planktotalea sp.]|uniref:hypothetical protein n=1 Tax=Planktotalea sp. TaxID=2029877 RepID=UPI003C783865